MKKHIKRAIYIVMIIVISFWIIDKIPFEKAVSHQISADIYHNGIATENTVVSIDGSKTNHLFSKNESYYGKFEIPLKEITTMTDVNAEITWNKHDNIQEIMYMSTGVFETAGLHRYLLISEDMKAFVLMFEDGTILATSQELHDLYAKHFTHNSPDSMSITDTFGIPQIK